MATTNVHTIEGSDEIKTEWNGYGFKFITKSDYPAVLTHLRCSFHLEEPLCKTLGYSPERSADIDQKVSDILDLNQGSFFAYPLDEPDKVVAVLIVWFQEKGKSLPPFEPRSPVTDIVKYVITKLHKRYVIHEERNVTVYPELFIVSTDKNYRGKGIATQMYRKAISQLSSQGYPFVTSTFTNPFSRKIGERLGFKVVSRIDFEECMYPDGSAVFGEAGKSQFAVETILELQNTFEWKQFHIRCIQPSDHPSVLAHLKTFYVDEPVNQWMGISKERISDQDRRMTDMMSRHKKSLMAVLKSDPAKIAGVLIIHFHEVGNPLPQFTPASPITTTYKDFLRQMEHSFNIHETYGISCFPELAILSTDNDFRGFGLATELCRRAISQLFSEGEDTVPLIYSEFSNPISRSLGERLGFQEKARFYFKQFQKSGATRDSKEDCDYENGNDCADEPYVSLTVLHREQ